MHSSRMRTARPLTPSRSIHWDMRHVCWGDACLMGVHAEWVCVCVCAWGAACLPRGPYMPRGVNAMHDPPPHGQNS